MTISISRRDFLKSSTAFGLGLMGYRYGDVHAAAHGHAYDRASASAVVPRQPFGASAEKVSQLALGCAFDTHGNHLLLHRALAMGVNYWDTGTSYGYGRSEEGIGRFFKRFPEQRANVFLCTKSEVRLPEGMTWALEESLRRLQTSYVDFYCAHAIGSIDVLDGELEKWVAQAKKDGKIRYFGISTHKNMQACMLGAVRLGWIDGIMMSYNYRLMNLKSMQQAVSACQKAGIALVAMKTQALAADSLVGKEQSHHEKTYQPFLSRGYTPFQARLKAVWENDAITSICSYMPNMAILKANAAAAGDSASLSQLEQERLSAFSLHTQPAYCAGCGSICEATFAQTVPIADVMRHLMYHRGYEDKARAHRFFRDLPLEIRRRLLAVDYGRAERRCPQNMAIGRLMQEAMEFSAS